METAVFVRLGNINTHLLFFVIFIKKPSYEDLVSYL